MTLTLDNLTSEEIRIVQEAERRGIRFEALVKGLIAGLRETAAPEHAPVPGVISRPPNSPRGSVPFHEARPPGPPCPLKTQVGKPSTQTMIRRQFGRCRIYWTPIS
jgi:hypothetical protein